MTVGTAKSGPVRGDGPIRGVVLLEGFHLLINK